MENVTHPLQKEVDPLQEREEMYAKNFSASKMGEIATNVQLENSKSYFEGLMKVISECASKGKNETPLLKVTEEHLPENLTRKRLTKLGYRVEIVPGFADVENAADITLGALFTVFSSALLGIEEEKKVYLIKVSW